MEEKMYFKVNQTIEETDCKAFVKSLQSTKTIWILYGTFGALSVILSLLSREVPQMITSVLLAAALIALALRYPVRAAKIQMKNMRTLSGSPVVNAEVVFCENYIYDCDANSNRRYSYSQIISVTDKDNYYFLMLYKKAGLIIKKEAFNYGDPNALKNFIDSKHFGA